LATDGHTASGRLTGEGAGYRASRSLPLGEFQAAVDGEDLAGEPGRGRVGQAQDPQGDLVGLAATAEGDAGGLVSLDLFDGGLGQPGSGQSLAFGGAGARALTRTPSVASSAAQLRVSCSRAALEAA
jgi:hypothetical protein